MGQAPYPQELWNAIPSSAPFKYYVFRSVSTFQLLSIQALVNGKRMGAW